MNQNQPHVGDADEVVPGNDNDNDNQGNANQGAQLPVVNRIAVKIPPFYRANPATWFRQIESQFIIGGITADITKYHYVVANLPEDVALSFLDLSDEQPSYQALKQAVTTLYQKSKSELIEEALGTVSLDGQKPSLVVARIRRKLRECNLTVDDDLLRHKLLQALPVTARTAMAGHQALPPEEFAKLADTILQFVQPGVDCALTHATASSATAPVYRANYNQSAGFGDSSSSQTVYPFSAGQKPMICRYHVYFADKAKRCKDWCRWPGAKPSQRDPSSRPSSPSVASNQGN